MTGGTCSTRLLSVGRYGTGTFSISGPATVMTATDGVRVGFTNGGNNGVGTVAVTNDGKIATSSVYGGGTAANQAHVTFDGGVLQGLSSGEMLKNVCNVSLGLGGLALETDGYDLGVTNCTFNVTPGAKIVVTGGGVVTFADVTVNLTETPSGSFTFAETDGTFSGMPSFSYRRWKMVKSADSKRISIISPGLMIIVK